MNYPDSIRFLYSLGNELKTAKLDLARIAILLEGNLRRLAIVQLRDRGIVGQLPVDLCILAGRE